jgi:hypothetical protein
MDPNKLQKLSGAHSFITNLPELPIIAISVTAEATNAVVVAASIGTVAPELNAVATVTAAPVARLVIPAFLSVVHPTTIQQVAMTTNQ